MVTRKTKGTENVPVRNLLVSKRFNVTRKEAKAAFIKGFLINARKDKRLFKKEGITKIKFVDPKGKNIVKRI